MPFATPVEGHVGQAEQIGMIAQGPRQKQFKLFVRDVRCDLTEGGAEEAAVEIGEGGGDEMGTPHQEVTLDLQRKKEGDLAV